MITAEGIAFMEWCDDVLAIDTDILLYKAATSAETEIDWGDDVWSLYTDLSDAKSAFEMQLDKITQKLGVHDFVCCLSDHGGNFRKLIRPTSRTGRSTQAGRICCPGKLG